MKPITFVQEREHFNTARLKKFGHVFEIAIELDAAMLFKHGNGELRDVLRSEHIFLDAQKGEVASPTILNEAFSTDDPLKVAAIILKEGELHLTAEHKQKLRDEKRRRIIDIIHRNAVEPKMHVPHPINRIESAIEHAKVHIDEFRSAEDQVQDVVKKIREILPLKFETKEIEVSIPAEYAVRCYGSVKSLGKILKDNWDNEGSWVGIIEIPGGLEDELYDKLNKMTHGNIHAKVIKVK
jgi:ribosome maturation protein SDO1